MKKFIIVDGYAFIFRSFFAIKHSLTNSKGVPTNAILGFVQLFLRIKARLRPEFLLVVFDSGGKTFRDELYPHYKANRPPCPEALIPQFEIAKKALEAMDIPFVFSEGFEADDLIATYSRLAKEQGGIRTEILSFDKDLMQLIEDGVVEMYNETSGAYVKSADVVAKFGVKPSFIVDYLSLVGDSSDNVPGVSGIGPKNAGILINEFGTIEQIYAHLPNVRNKILLKRLEEGQETAFLSKKLVSLNSYANIKINNFQTFFSKNFDLLKLRHFLQEYELFSIINTLIRDYNLPHENPDKKPELAKQTQGDLF
jgi:DNA polymerase-1